MTCELFFILPTRSCLRWNWSIARSRRVRRKSSATFLRGTCTCSSSWITSGRVASFWVAGNPGLVQVHVLQTQCTLVQPSQFTGSQCGGGSGWSWFQGQTGPCLDSIVGVHHSLSLLLSVSRSLSVPALLPSGSPSFCPVGAFLCVAGNTWPHCSVFAS